MGFFSQGNYRITNYLENVQADPNYMDSTAPFRSIVEGYENDRLFFEAMLDYDFREASLIHESAGNEELVALQENMITSFFSKLKELFKKLWSKIKAIFNGFIAKFSAKLGSDNKAFAKKYRTEIYKKNLTNFETKYEKPNKDVLDSFLALDKAKTYSIDLSDDQKFSQAKLKTLIEDWDAEDEEVEALKALTDCKDVDSTKDFAKTIHEWCFEDKDTIEGDTEVKAALTHLENADKTISNVKKAADKIGRAIENVIKDVDKMDTNWFKHLKWDEKALSGTGGYKGAGTLYKSVSYDISGGTKATFANKDTANTGDGTGNAGISSSGKEYAQSLMNLMSKKANIAKTAFNKVSASCLKEAKFYIAQDRMLVAKAVAYRPKQESTELVSQEEMDFFGDIAAWEVETELR